MTNGTAFCFKTVSQSIFFHLRNKGKKFLEPKLKRIKEINYYGFFIVTYKKNICSTNKDESNNKE